MSRADKIKEILNTLQVETPDVEGVLLLNMDGLVMASVLSAEFAEVEESIGARATSILSIGSQTLHTLKKGELNRILVQGEDGFILLVEAGKESVLTVFTTKKAKIGMIFFDANHAAVEISKILE